MINCVHSYTNPWRDGLWMEVMEFLLNLHTVQDLWSWQKCLSQRVDKAIGAGKLSDTESIEINVSRL